MRQFLPNTYPPGGANPCLPCPSGFLYVTSGGSSSRHAGQILLRRRLRGGWTASGRYTLATAVDDAASFSGTTVTGGVTAQDWLHLEAEHGPSSFDQRHTFTADVQYTTGVGVSGGALLDGWKGTLFKGWTMAGQVTTGSGRPVTPIFLVPIPGTGVVGIRPDTVSGVDPRAAPPGGYLNPAAYAAPLPGQWGNAGRNSARGPAEFSMNASLSRTFNLGDRVTLEWRIDATNVLNRVTYAALNTVVGSSQFGLPTVANPMRRIQTGLRLRY
jgi:hypothetical protein